MYEEVIYSYFNTIGDYVWCGTKTGEHIISMNWADSEPTNIMTTKMYFCGFYTKIDTKCIKSAS